MDSAAPVDATAEAAVNAADDEEPPKRQKLGEMCYVLRLHRDHKVDAEWFTIAFHAPL